MSRGFIKLKSSSPPLHAVFISSADDWSQLDRHYGSRSSGRSLVSIVSVFNAPRCPLSRSCVVRVPPRRLALGISIRRRLVPTNTGLAPGCELMLVTCQDLTRKAFEHMLSRGTAFVWLVLTSDVGNHGIGFEISRLVRCRSSGAVWIEVPYIRRTCHAQPGHNARRP